MVKFHPPIEENREEPIIVKDETISYNIDPVVSTAYVVLQIRERSIKS